MTELQRLNAQTALYVGAVVCGVVAFGIEVFTWPHGWRGAWVPIAAGFALYVAAGLWERLARRRRVETLTLHARLRPDWLEDGWLAECAEFPGCMGQGETQEDAMRSLAEAVADVHLARVGRRAQWTEDQL